MSFRRVCRHGNMVYSVLVFLVLPLALPAQQVGLGAELLVESDPPGAEVTLDGTSYGHTPIHLNETRPGRRRLVLTHRGYEIHDDWLFLPAGEETIHSVVLKPLAQTVTFSSNSPFPLEIYLQGEWREATTAVLPPGNHNLWLRSFGYAETRQGITVPAGDSGGSTTYHVELIRLVTHTVGVETLRHAVNDPGSSRSRSGLLRVETTGPSNITVVIRDEKGRPRYERTFPAKERVTLFSWDGVTTDGTVLSPGTYTAETFSHTAEQETATTTIRIVSGTKTAPFVLSEYGTGSSLFHLPGTSADISALVVAGGGMDSINISGESTGGSAAFLGASFTPWNSPIVSGRIGAYAGPDMDGLSGSISMAMESPEIRIGTVGSSIFSTAPALSARFSSRSGDDLSGAGLVTVMGTLNGFGVALVPMVHFSSERAGVAIDPGAGGSLFYRQGQLFTALSGRTINGIEPSLAVDIVFYPLSGPSGFQLSLLMDDVGGEARVTALLGVGVGIGVSTR